MSATVATINLIRSDARRIALLDAVGVCVDELKTLNAWLEHENCGKPGDECVKSIDEANGAVASLKRVMSAILALESHAPYAPQNEVPLGNNPAAEVK